MFLRMKLLRSTMLQCPFELHEDSTMDVRLAFLLVTVTSEVVIDE